MPGVNISLISNPLDPAVWSDTIKVNVMLDPARLSNGALESKLNRAKERFGQMIKHHYEVGSIREIERIVAEVCKKHGLGEKDVIPKEFIDSITFEVSQRVAAHALGLPFEEAFTKEQVELLLKNHSSDKPIVS